MSRRSGRAAPRPRPAPDRGLSPVVGKTLELGVGVLFVALLTATFFGGIAPEYRTAVGAELGERTLVAAAERVVSAVPTRDFARVERRVTVRLPPTIRSRPYRIAVSGEPDGHALGLVHPDPSIGGRVRLAVPAGASVSGSWTSSSASRAVVSATRDGVSVRLVDLDRATPADRTGGPDPPGGPA